MGSESIDAGLIQQQSIESDPIDPIQANNPPPIYNQIVIFGDSLSDNGNLYNTTWGLIPKSPPYYKGRFTNGPAWSDLIAEYFYDKNHVLTTNYAVGGETVNLHNPLKGFLPYTFSNSLNSYFLHTPFQDRTHTLFVIWLSANDYLKGAINPDLETTNVINTMQKNIDRLIRSGGENFLMINLLDLAAVPLNSDSTTRDTLHTLTLLHNTKLQSMVDTMQKEHADIKIRLFDAYHFYENMANNLPAYNQKYHTHIQNMTDSCWGGGLLGAEMTVSEDEIRYTLEAEYRQKTAMAITQENKTPPDFNALAHYIATTPTLLESYRVSQHATNERAVCADPDNYVFWDHVHPTASMHRIFISILIDQINQFW